MTNAQTFEVFGVIAAILTIAIGMYQIGYLLGKNTKEKEK